MYRINMEKFMKRAVEENMLVDAVKEIACCQDELYDLNELESFYDGEQMVFNINGFAVYENEFTGGWCRL